MESTQAIAKFYKSEEIYPLAFKHFQIEAGRINELCPRAQVEYVGSSSIPGALTLGDLDIQIRVTREDFPKLAEELKALYHVNRPELWTNEFALYHWKDHTEIPMSIVLTVMDSVYDDFSKTRDLLKNDPELLEQYNALKRAHDGKSLKEYKQAKKDFFGLNGQNKLLNKK